MERARRQDIYIILCITSRSGVKTQCNIYLFETQAVDTLVSLFSLFFENSVESTNTYVTRVWDIANVVRKNENVVKWGEKYIIGSFFLLNYDEVFKQFFTHYIVSERADFRE